MKNVTFIEKSILKIVETFVSPAAEAFPQTPIDLPRLEAEPIPVCTKHRLADIIFLKPIFEVKFSGFEVELWSLDFEVKYRWPILSGISYHCKVRIRISADLHKVKYRPIISVDRYISRSLVPIAWWFLALQNPGCSKTLMIVFFRCLTTNLSRFC